MNPSSAPRWGLFLTLAFFLTACRGGVESLPSDHVFEQVQSTGAQFCSSGPIPGCSVFTISKGNQVYFGGNDDWIDPDSYYWVDQGDAENYGVIWIGMPDNVRQGVNVKGLAYDANGLPRVDVNPHLEREPVPGDYNIYPLRILHECATVEEVINKILNRIEVP